MIKTFEDLVTNGIITTCDLETIKKYEIDDSSNQFNNVYFNKAVKDTSDSKYSVVEYFSISIKYNVLCAIGIYVTKDTYVDNFKKIKIFIDHSRNVLTGLEYLEYNTNGETKIKFEYSFISKNLVLMENRDKFGIFKEGKIEWEIIKPLFNNHLISYTELPSLYTPLVIKKDNVVSVKELRKFLFSLVITPTSYTDDGELQLNCRDGKTIDFKREDINVLIDFVKTNIENRNKEKFDKTVKTVDKVVKHFTDIHKDLYLRNGQYKFNQDAFWFVVASIVEFIYSQDIQDEDLINLLKKRKSVQWFILASIAHCDYFENNDLTLKERFKAARSITSSILGCEADISKYHIVDTDVKKIKVYIAGPMSGLPNRNYEAFYKAEELLISKGYQVFNPARLNDPHPGSREKALRNDYRALIECDAVALLPGWENSDGVGRELSIANDLKLEVKDLDKY